MRTLVSLLSPIVVFIGLLPGCSDPSGDDCQAEEIDASERCASEGRLCGSFDLLDSCEELHSVFCGSCDDDLVCSSAGLCVSPDCVPESDDLFCSRLSIECSMRSDIDNCGEPREAYCGACDNDLICSSAGRCVSPDCVPESDDMFCTRFGFECEVQTDIDNCGEPRTVTCGACDDDLICSSAGRCVSPDCVPESDEDYCDRHGVSCGEHNGIDNCGEARTVTCGDPCSPVELPMGWYGEFEIDDPRYAAAANSRSIRIVDVGTHYLALWVDGRSNKCGWAVSDPIIATRLSYDGEVLDPGGVMLAEPGSDLYLVDLLFDGSEAILVMREEITVESRRLLLLRLDRNGRPLEDEPREVATGYIFSSVAAFDGTKIILLWQTDTGMSIQARAVTPGTLDMGPEQTIAPATWGSYLSLAVHEGLSMVSWIQYDSDLSAHRLRVTTLDEDAAPTIVGGEVLDDPLGDLVLGYDTEPHTLWPTPSGFALVHEHYDSSSDERRLHATFFDDRGIPLESSPLALHEKPGDDNYYAKCEVRDDDWLVTFSTDAGREFIVVDSTAEVITSGPMFIPESEYGAHRFVCHTSECTIAYETPFPTQAYIQRYTPTFDLIGDSIDVPTTADHQFSPIIAFDGVQYIVLWRSGLPSHRLDGPYPRLLRYRRLSTDGRWLDADPVDIPEVEDMSYGYDVTAYSSGGFLLQWMEDNGYGNDRLYARRMNDDGTWAWPEPMHVMDAPTTYGLDFVTCACAEENCLFTFVSGVNSFEFMILDGSGSELVGRGPLPASWDQRSYPSARADSHGLFWLVATQDDELQVRTIIASGAEAGLPGPESYDIPREIDSGVFGAYWQEMGDDILIVYHHLLDDGYYLYLDRIEARWLTPGVGVSDPVVLVDEPPIDSRWVGSTLVGDELHSYYVEYLFEYHQLFRSRHDRTLGVVEEMVPVFDTGWFGTINIVSELMAYNRLDWDVGFGGDRVRLTWVGDRSWLGADSAVCSDDGQCASGRCRDGSCCDDCPLWRGL